MVKAVFGYGNMDQAAQTETSITSKEMEAVQLGDHKPYLYQVNLTVQLIPDGHSTILLIQLM